MATFKVGQRVRLVGMPTKEDMPADDKIAIVGSVELTIVSEVDVFQWFLGWSGDYEVRSDDGSVHGTAYVYQLAPIQPERNQVVAWAECPWRPEHLRESVQ